MSARGGPLSVVRSAGSALFPFLCSTPRFSLSVFKKNPNNNKTPALKHFTQFCLGSGALVASSVLVMLAGM